MILFILMLFIPISDFAVEVDSSLVELNIITKLMFCIEEVDKSYSDGCITLDFEGMEVFNGSAIINWREYYGCLDSEVKLIKVEVFRVVEMEEVIIYEEF